MHTLNEIEMYVANSLKNYFKDTTYQLGEDPPDIYLHINGKKIAVEITQLDKNVINNERTINAGYLKFIKNLQKDFNDQLSYSF